MHGRTIWGGLMVMVGLMAGAAWGSEGEKSAGGDPGEVLKRVQAKYEGMRSYSDVGEVVSEIDMSGVNFGQMPHMTPEMEKKMKERPEFKKPQKLTTTFSIKLARPELYLVEWRQAVHPAFTNAGAVWSNGSGNFIALPGQREPQKVSDQEIALAMATGVSAGAAHTVPQAFFALSSSILKTLHQPVFQKEEAVEGDLCYVISGEVVGQNMWIWISKKSLLIRQQRHILGGTKPMAMPKISDEDLKKTLQKMGQEATPEAIARMRKTMADAGKMTQNIRGHMTEIHREIKVNPSLAKSEFTPKITTNGPTSTSKPVQVVPMVPSAH